jgi:hypothetical protein
MNQPSILVRLCGTRIAAIPLALTGMWLVYAWTQGRTSCWLALMGFFMTVRTIGCVRQRNRYNAWRKQWDAIGTFGKPPAPHRSKSQWHIATLGAMALVIGIIVLGPQAAAENPQLEALLTWLWLLSGVFLAVRFVISIRNLVAKRRMQSDAEGEPKDHIVALALDRTLDSPSREDARRNLPNYAACILNRRGEQNNGPDG